MLSRALTLTEGVADWISPTNFVGLGSLTRRGGTCGQRIRNEITCKTQVNPRNQSWCRARLRVYATNWRGEKEMRSLRHGGRVASHKWTMATARALRRVERVISQLLEIKQLRLFYAPNPARNSAEPNAAAARARRAVCRSGATSHKLGVQSTFLNRKFEILFAPELFFRRPTSVIVSVTCHTDQHCS